MSKKQFLELLIKSYGLTPNGIGFYKTDSCGGQYQSSTGWKGSGIDVLGKHLIKFHEPDGFNMAVHEIIQQAKKHDLEPIFVSPTL